MRMLLGLGAVLALALTGAAAAQTEAILIFGGADHKTFLGCLTCSELDGDSVWNQFSTHGWNNSFGTWNEFGPYRNEFSSTSACGDFAGDPPVLVDRKGSYYGRLSVSTVRSDSVCGPAGAEKICTALKVMCSGK